MLQKQQPAQLRTEQAGEIAILTIDRPERRNALGQQLIEELFTELDRADRDPAVRVIVLTGSAPGFCAGSDLKELAGADLAGMGTHEARTAALARSIALMNKPVVGGIEGFALGGGFVLAVSCDIVVSEPSARWHLPEVAIGWIPPGESRRSLRASARSLGAGRFRGADPFDGREAHRLGIADFVASQAKQRAMPHFASQCGWRHYRPRPSASTKQFRATRVRSG